MPTTTTVIPAEFEPFVRERIDTGKYQSEQEVLTAALTLWKLREEQMDELRAKIQVGIDQLDRGEKVDGETVVQELREKLARLKELQS